VIAVVSGKVLETRIDGLVINVGGIGLFVLCAPDLIARAKIGEEISVNTSLVVREDSLTLFGFESVLSRELFEIVQSVSGFGPKLAFTILAAMSPDEFREAIANEDVNRLKQTPGVGAKGAQRLVLELKDRIGFSSNQLKSTNATSNWKIQLEQGLVGLGWSTKDANKAIATVAQEISSDDSNGEVEIALLLKRALQILAKS
jgi:Holliday junction DNA helicase RuvA